MWRRICMTVQAFNGASNSLLTHAIENANTDGAFLEFGVYKGASINFIADTVGNNITVHGFDSFTGLPTFWRPGYKEGIFNLDGRMPRVAKNCTVV